MLGQLNVLDLEQYRIRKSKSADIQALNTQLFYDLTRLKRFPPPKNLPILYPTMTWWFTVLSPLSFSVQKLPNNQSGAP